MVSFWDISMILSVVVIVVSAGLTLMTLTLVVGITKMLQKHEMVRYRRR